MVGMSSKRVLLRVRDELVMYFDPSGHLTQACLWVDGVRHRVAVQMPSVELRDIFLLHAFGFHPREDPRIPLLVQIDEVLKNSSFFVSDIARNPLGEWHVLVADRSTRDRIYVAPICLMSCLDHVDYSVPRSNPLVRQFSETWEQRVISMLGS